MNYGIPLHEPSSSIYNLHDDNDDDDDIDESCYDYSTIIAIILFLFFSSLSFYIIPLGIFYSMSADKNSFEIELKYEIYRLQLFSLFFFVLINRGLYTNTFNSLLLFYPM